MTTASLSNATPLRIGILGCANIARQFVRDVAASPDVRVVAAASRNAENAAAFAAGLNIPRSLGSYEALLADDGTDAVYIPLPNSLHAEWASKAAQAGKHILCEKPLSLGLAEAQAMFSAARSSGVMLLEAYPYYFQPQTGALLGLLGEGAIGEVRSVQASFGFVLSRPEGNIRFNPALGGGALLDAGCYALSIIRLVMGTAPVKVLADSSWDPSGVDISTMATLHYADGRRAQLSCAMDTANHRRAVIMGSAGTIETEYLNHTSERSGRPSLGLSAERVAAAPRHFQRDPLRNRAQRRRQRLPLRGRGLRPGGERRGLRSHRAGGAGQPGQRGHAGGHRPQRAQRPGRAGGPVAAAGLAGLHASTAQRLGPGLRAHQDLSRRS